jgi:hypothetical protein
MSPANIGRNFFFPAYAEDQLPPKSEERLVRASAEGRILRQKGTRIGRIQVENASNSENFH